MLQLTDKEIKQLGTEQLQHEKSFDTMFTTLEEIAKIKHQ